MNIKLRKKPKDDFEKDFFVLMNNVAFGKTMENVRKHRDIKIVTTDKRRKKLASEPNYHTTKSFSENLMAIEMKKTIVKMNKPVYLGMSILDISKTLMDGFWYDYIKPKYQERAKLCYMILTALLFISKPKIFMKELPMMLKNGSTHLTMMKMIKDCFQQERKKKVISPFKYELAGKILKELVGLRAKACVMSKHNNFQQSMLA